MSETNLKALPDEAIIRLVDVLRLVPVSRATWLRGVKSGIYPKPLRLSTRAVGWRLKDVLSLSRTAS